MNISLLNIKKAGNSISGFDLSINQRNKLFVVSVLFVFVALLALNINQPLLTDDWEYSFKHRLIDLSQKETVSDERISSLSDIPASQYEHYFIWGGRSVNHCIAQVLLLVGSPINKVLNSLAYVALTLVIYSLARRKNSAHSLSLYILINILIFFFQPVLGATLLWITGSSNYLWGTLIILLFLLPYKSFYESDSNNKSSLFKTFLMFPAGIIAGWTNENMAAVMILLLIGLALYQRIQKKVVPLWFYSGLLGAVIGFCFMVAAPGNYARYSIAVMEQGMQEGSKLMLLFNQFLTAMSGVFFHLLGIIALYFIVLLLYFFFGKKDSKSLLFSLAFFPAALLATLAMTFSPSFPERAWFGIIIFIIIAIASVYSRLDFSILFIRQLRLIVISFCLIALLGYYVSGYKDLARTKRIYDQREQVVLDGKKNGVFDFTFPEEVKSKSRINNVYELSPDPDYWVNCYYCRYYGISSVRIMPQN